MKPEDKKTEDVIVAEDAPVKQELSDEIAGAVDEVVTKKQTAEEAAKIATGELPPEEEEVIEDDLPPEEEESEGEESDKGNKKPDVDTSVAISDSDLERAVKAGMTMATARTFKDAKALNEVVNMLKPKGDEGAIDDKKVSELSDSDELLASIPDLDPEQYDENVVAGFKALKGLVGSMSKTISALQQAGAASGVNAFDASVSALDATVAKELQSQPAKLTELKDKFDVIKAGYKASGKNVDHDTAFKEAAAIVLGDVISGVKVTVKREQLASRAKGHTFRPTGSSTKPSKVDPSAEAAELIDKKYFDKK